MIKNLKNANYDKRLYVTTAVDALYAEAQSKNSAYLYSIPLLASAQLGDEKLYQKILIDMRKALSSIPSDQNSFKAWLLGRILLAADNIGDADTVTKITAELTSLIKDEKTSRDEFAAWAWGYLASLNKEEYAAHKQNMLTAAQNLSDQYQTLKKKLSSSSEGADVKEQEQLHTLLSNALWAWVMALQATANADDKETYKQCLAQMKAMENQASVSAALIKGLLRTAASNDYPAWALSIVRNATATINDEAVYTELAQSTQTSIEAAKIANAKAEEVLAILNQQIAIERWNQRVSNAVVMQAKNSL